MNNSVPTVTTVERSDEDPDSGLCIVVVHGGVSRRLPLPRAGHLTIGRSSRCAIQVDDNSVSSEHAVLLIGSDLRVQDLGSRNGTAVAQRRLARGETAVVGLGEAIVIGHAMLVIRPLNGPAVVAPAQPEPSADDVLLVSTTLQRQREQLERVAASDLSVVILGETGVGKDVLAREMHALSGRRGRFVALCCAALPESLIESELFGHERGAFTGAQSEKQGLLEIARGGTVFLDEIGELPLSCQAKLLRVLEDRSVVRVGGVKPIALDVRYIAATNRRLDAEIQRGGFRPDLYFRLAGFQLDIPPLRERRDEIEPLAKEFLAQACRRMGLPAMTLASSALDALRARAWPGNIRELRNVIERTAIMSSTTELTADMLQLSPAPADTEPPDAQSSSAERAALVDALSSCGGNQTRTARFLNISRSTLIRRMKQYGLPRPRLDDDIGDD